MYIISILDNWPDGSSSTYVKITKHEAIKSVIDEMKKRHAATMDITRRVICNNMIKKLSEGCMSFGIGDGTSNTLAYDICSRDEWETKKQEEIARTKKEIEDLQLFIKKTKEKLAQLDNVGHL